MFIIISFTMYFISRIFALITFILFIVNLWGGFVFVFVFLMCFLNLVVYCVLLIM